MGNVEVNVAGKKLGLSGNDPDLIRKTAEMVDKEISSMQKQLSDEPDSMTLTILAALNIAEKQIIGQEKLLKEKELILNKINSLTKKFEDLLESDPEDAG